MFLLLLQFIHTLEEQQNFSQRDRGYVASLLTMALHDKLEYFTDVMKTLLGDLVQQYVAKNPKLMLRRYTVHPTHPHLSVYKGYYTQFVTLNTFSVKIHLKYPGESWTTINLPDQVLCFFPQSKNMQWRKIEDAPWLHNILLWMLLKV